MQYAVCSMQYAVCSMQYALCSMQYALCTMHYAVCNMQCAVCSVQFVVLTVEDQKSSPGLRATVATPVSHQTHRPVFHTTAKIQTSFAQGALYKTAYFLLNTEHGVQYTIQFAVSTIVFTWQSRHYSVQYISVHKTHNNANLTLQCPKHKK